MPYCSESNPSPEQIIAELKFAFGNGHPDIEASPFWAGCIAIAEFLSNTGQVKAQLSAMDRNIRLKVEHDYQRVMAHYKARFKGLRAGDTAILKTKLDAALKHLVSGELTRLETLNGFNSFACAGSERLHVQTYVKFIEPEAFRSQVRACRHWKDVSVGVDHGEYTHRIQWYMIANALTQQVPQPLQTFMTIGGIVNEREQTTKPNKRSGLWDALFDRNDGRGDGPFKVTPRVTDARCPESLTDLIVDEQQGQAGWPLLHWFVAARDAKRARHPIEDKEEIEDYIAAKANKFGLGLQQTMQDVVGDKLAKGSGMLRLGKAAGGTGGNG